jgi:pimeloyl-ACP methyl ester carboxylesterase
MTTPIHEAVLVTGAIETHYRRAGNGRPLLLLLPCNSADSAGKQLFEGLATRCRVIAPVQPPGVPFSDWLRDLIDGLGLDRPYLIVDTSIAEVARGFAQVEDERVGGVVAVDPAADPSTLVEQLRTLIGSIGGAPDRTIAPTGDDHATGSANGVRRAGG